MTRPEPDSIPKPVFDFNLVAQHLLAAAEELADACGAARIIVFLDGLPDDPEISARLVIVTRGGGDADRAQRLAELGGAAVLDVPDVALDRTGQVNLATLMALSQKIITRGDATIFLAGESGKPADTVHVMTVGDRFDLLETIDETPGSRHVKSAVFQRVVTIALALAGEGREGKPVGAFFVVGDSEKVAGHCEQLIMNPFLGYPEEARNILDSALAETVKEFSTIDGAFVIRGDGVIVSAGTLVQASLVSEDLPKGLGARHAAAAGITKVTGAVAITVSESDGTARVWRKGKIVTAFERAV